MMTSDKLARDLRDIDELITALSAADSNLADVDDLHWLLERRRSVSELLAMRRAQRGKKIVSLAMWRHGCATEANKWPGSPDVSAYPYAADQGFYVPRKGNGGRAQAPPAASVMAVISRSVSSGFSK
jgi:hypothetical protein